MIPSSSSILQIYLWKFMKQESFRFRKSYVPVNILFHIPVPFFFQMTIESITTMKSKCSSHINIYIYWLCLSVLEWTPIHVYCVCERWLIINHLWCMQLDRVRKEITHVRYKHPVLTPIGEFKGEIWLRD